jgi:DNA-binding response OmpR family regulator
MVGCLQRNKENQSKCSDFIPYSVGNPENIVLGLESGGDDYLVKPLSLLNWWPV